jgi:hypothetical protein
VAEAGYRARRDNSGYVEARIVELEQRYVGVLTDGAQWHLHHFHAGARQLVSSISIDPRTPDVEGLCVWLEGVLATAEKIAPTPTEIARRLGATSPAHALGVADLTALYRQHRDDPGVALKRQLWTKPLTTALGTSFRGEDELFVEHTLVVGFDRPTRRSTRRAARRLRAGPGQRTRTRGGGRHARPAATRGRAGAARGQGLRRPRVRRLRHQPRRHVPAPRPQNEKPRFGRLGGMRQWVESVFDTAKGQLSLERHGGRTLAGVFTLVTTRLLALAASIWHNWQTGNPGRHLTAYDH